MRILLTGVTGQVGSALRAPLTAFADVTAPLRNELDLAAPEMIAAYLDRTRPDLIVNPAAYTAVDRAEDEPALAERVNADAPGRIAEWAARHDVPMIHVSTDYVYDGSGQAPWHEDDPTLPLSVYGRSKLAGEQAVRRAGGRHLIVRTSWVYSNHGSNFMLTMARLAAERRELRVVADQFGAPTSARVIADALSRIIASDPGLRRSIPGRGDIIHLACAGVTNWHGFAQAIVTGLRRRGLDVVTETVTPIATEDYPTRACRPRNSRLDLGRLEKQFGIGPVDWRDALRIELDMLAELRRATLRPAIADAGVLSPVP